MCEYKNKRTVGGELRGEGVGREALGGVQRRLRSNLFKDDGCTGKQSAFGNSFGNSFGDGLAICLAMGPNDQKMTKCSPERLLG